MSSYTPAFENDLNAGLLATLDLANHVYELPKPKNEQAAPPAGWEVHKTFGMKLQNLDSAVLDTAAIYVNKKLGEVCYVSRGSVTAVDWGVDDFCYVVPELFLKFTSIGLLPHELPRVSNAAQNIKEMMADPLLSEYRMYLAGHSLGGYVVKAAAIFHGYRLPVISFNGPGWFEWPIIGSERANILEITNCADIVGNYRNKCTNEIFVNTGDTVNKSNFWDVFIPLVGPWIGSWKEAVAYADFVKRAHGLGHIRDKLAAAMTHSNKPDLALHNFGGQNNDGLKKVFTDRIVFPTARLADKDIFSSASHDAASVTGTQVQHSIMLQEGKVTLSSSVELNGQGTRQMQQRYSDGSGHCMIASTDPDEKRAIHLPIPATPHEAMSMHTTANTFQRDDTQTIRDQIFLLHGVGFDPLPQTFNAAFALFIQMPSNPNSIFFAKAAAATGPDSGYELALMFGDWIEDPAALQPGDLVYFNSPFVSDGSSWGILAERMTEGTHKVLYPNKKTYQGEYLRDVPVSLVQGWRPHYTQSLDEQSPLGRFWGPLMSKLRAYIEICDGAADEDALLRCIAERTDCTYSSIQDFVTQHEKELQPLKAGTPPPFGSVVLTADEQGIGVHLNDHRVNGLRRHGEEPGHWTLKQFAAARYWTPR